MIGEPNSFEVQHYFVVVEYEDDENTSVLGVKLPLDETRMVVPE